MTKTLLNKALMAAAAVAITTTGFAASASAQNRTVRSVAVDYSDLDLVSAAGKATLQGRIKGAVRQVCGSYDSKSLRDMADHGNCMEQASNSAQRATVTIMAAAAAGKPIKTALLVKN
ncbi:UrcA family protein [Parasphingorhabdus halotolerans]|uniref:UrcA family protein n=1 Tax=Parasphingorhabdus halotolerans TaxID=2725558 RepID=A0A6H2DNW2_9SPHN|nr:UrcA family protein [Parasphingorhabdus halotolerans]QJB70044.1 UrcA family protein [Parasphingorhabdus halotolerans]